MIGQDERRALGLLLDFEYCLAELYGRAHTGQGLTAAQRGEGAGPVVGGRRVAFKNPVIAAFVAEAARDCLNHIVAMRQFLSEVSERPYRASAIDLGDSFAALIGGVAPPRRGKGFDAFVNDTNLLLAAYTLEDVGMTACAHALAAVDLQWSRALLVGLFGSIASRSAVVRAFLFAAGLASETNAIATVRQQACSLFGTAYQGNDHGVGTRKASSMMALDPRGMAWARTPDQVAAILAGTTANGPATVFPAGIAAMHAAPHDRLRLTPVWFSAFAEHGRDDGIVQLSSFAGEPVTLPPLHLDLDGIELHENTPHQPWTETAYTSWAPSCLEMPDALVHGAVGIVGVGTHAINETLWHTEERRHRYARDGEAVVLDLESVETLEGKSVAILTGAAESYWHSLIDGVARLTVIPEDLWPQVDRVLYPSTGVGAAEMLRLWGLPPGVEVREVRPQESFRARRLIQPSSLHGLFDYHPGLLTAAFARLRSNVDLDTATPRKIFIDRRGSPLRRLSNEDDLIAALPEFTPVRLETLSVAQQIALFANAEIVVAPHGAGLTNIGFCRPGTIVVELMMDLYCNWCYRRLAAIGGLDYRVVMGRCDDPVAGRTFVHFATWTVDKASLLRESDATKACLSTGVSGG